MTCDVQVVLDPSEVATGRTEIDITPWLSQEGIDWGDAQVAAFMSETSTGEVPVNFRIPNRQASGGMIFVERGGTTGQAARALVQQKVALFQREGGWVKRVMPGAAGTVYADVVDATFHATSPAGIFARGSIDPSASISFSMIPEFYGNEVTLDDHSTTTAAELVWNETTISGDLPGRIRMVIDNDQATAQESLIYGFRGRNYGTALSERLVWEAESLTPGHNATKVALAGASGGTVVRHGTLTTSWLGLIGGTYAFTHQGHYRVFSRVYSSTSGTVSVRWTYSTDGDASWNYNNQVDMVGSGFKILDLGQVDVRNSPIGPSPWSGWAEAEGAAGGEDIRFDKFWFLPTDEYSGVIRENAMPSAQAGNELRTEGYFAKSGSNYWERPIYGDLPRLPVPKQTGGTVECFIKASRGTIGDPYTSATADAGIDDISCRITYRPSYLFVGTA